MLGEIFFDSFNILLQIIYANNVCVNVGGIILHCACCDSFKIYFNIWKFSKKMFPIKLFSELLRTCYFIRLWGKKDNRN